MGALTISLPILKGLIMNIISRLGLALVFLGLVGGCSTPRVIEATKLSDRDFLVSP